VDENGVLVNCFSGSDLRWIGTDLAEIREIYLPLKIFLDLKPKTAPIGPVSISESFSVKEISDLFNRFRIHRIFVVNDQKKPIGVISLGTYLSWFRILNKDFSI